MYKWNHFINVGTASWIYRHDIFKLELNETFIRAFNSNTKYIDLPFIVFHNNEVIVNPSNHSLMRLSNEVADSLFHYLKEC